jgi:hypothetical protein
MLKPQVSIRSHVQNEQMPHPWGGAFWQMTLKSPPCPGRGGVGHFIDTRLMSLSLSPAPK